MLIAVEGMDGVGKTEISKYICENYDFIYIDKPLHYFYEDGPENGYADLMKVANRMYDIGDNFVKSWYFSLGNIYVARMFKGQNVVIDRHLVSNYYWNADVQCEPIFETLMNVSGVPDLTILLYATPKTRLQRMKKRDENDPDLDDPDKQDDGYNKMIYFLEKFKFPYVVIDTENKSLSEVKEHVDYELKRINLGKKLLKQKTRKRNDENGN